MKVKTESITGLIICAVLAFAPNAWAQETAEAPPEEASEGSPAAAEEGSEDESAEEPQEPSATDQMASARALFLEGVDFSDREQWAQASERFEAALELHDASSIRFNLAASYAQLGRRLEAAEQIDLVLADPNTPADLGTRARDLLAEIEPQIGSVMISAAGLAPGAQLLFDGQPLSPEQLSSSFRVETGDHSVTATLDGEEVAREQVFVSGGQAVDVALSPLQPVEEAVVEVAEVEEEPTPLVRNWRLWVGVGAGVVVLVTAIAVGVAVGGEDEVQDPVPGTMDPGVLYWR